MSVFALAWRYLWSRPLTTGLNVLLLTLSLTAIGAVLLAQDRIDHAFERDLAGIDAVVGAKGSPMQLILSGVFHLDVPTGNVALKDVQALAGLPQVAQVIPLSLGDSFQGFRIAGTTPAYPALFGASLADGRWWRKSMEAVLGASVAKASGLKAGRSFNGAHGLGAGGAVHSAHSYAVVGVLAPCGCVLDRLVLTDLASVWRVHESGLHVGVESDHGAEKLDAGAASEREVTLALVRYSSPMAAVSFPRFVNSQTPMQAASPALEITRLLGMVNVGVRWVQGMGGMLLVVAGLSMFVALWGAVRERRADMALLRMLGASPVRVAAVVFCEALLLAVLAMALSLTLAQGLMALLSRLWLADTGWAMAGSLWPPSLWSVPLVALLVALVAAAMPVLGAYRTDVAEALGSR